MDDKAGADKQYEVACGACGKTANTLDMADVRQAYMEKGWALPAASSCTPKKPAAAAEGAKPKAAEATPKDETKDSAAPASAAASAPVAVLTAVAAMFACAP